jgi:hypothetical protein
VTEKAQKVKQDLINLANNLDSAEGVIILKGMNTGDMNDFDVVYYEANPLLAIPTLLATLTDIYESALSNMEFGLAKGEFSPEELKKMDATVSNMLLKFNLLTKDLYEESLERRKTIRLKGIGSKEVGKEEN